jgi:hypothetical protein
MSPINVEAMQDDWLKQRIDKLERIMKGYVEQALDNATVVALINQQATPTADEIENSHDLALDLWSQDERISIDVQLEIDEKEQKHEWEVMLFLPSLLEGDSVVAMYHSSNYIAPGEIPIDEIPFIQEWLLRECERVAWHIERNEEENRANYRHDRDKKWDERQAREERERMELERQLAAEAARLEEERLQKEAAERRAAEDAWIDQEVRLADPLVGAF